MNFARSVFRNIVAIVRADVVVVERERHLVTMLAVRHPLECLAPDELVVELDVAPVAEVPRGEVVVLDVGRDEAAADRRRALVAVSRAATRDRPSTPHPCRRRAAARGSSPTRACSRSRRARRPGAARSSRPASTIASRTRASSSHGPNSSQPGCPAMPWRSARTVVPAIVTVVMWKNLSSGGCRRAASRSRCIAFGPCTWKRYDLRRPSVRSAQRWSSSTRDVVVAGLGVKGDPVERRCAADEVEPCSPRGGRGSRRRSRSPPACTERSASPGRRRSPRSC